MEREDPSGESSADVWHHAWQSADRNSWTPYQLFEANPIAHHALWAITCDLSRQPLRWTSGEPAGLAVQQFVDELVKTAFACGFAVWKTTKRGKLMVAHPDTVTVKCTDGEWVVESVVPPEWDDDSGWSASVMFSPPVHISSPGPWEWGSPVIKSALLSERVAKMEANWLDRDTHNSAPATFTTVTNRIEGSGTGAGSLQWYKSSALDNANNQGADELVEDDDFQTLLKNRTSLISALDEQATVRRNALADEASSGMMNDPRLKRRKVDHKEHAVSDGMDHREAKPLLSTADGRFHYDRARHQLFVELGVPPQALGESVNSERSGSNAAQYEVAMTLFARTVAKYRDFVDEVLSQATTIDTGKRVQYSPGLSMTQLSKLTPLLDPKQAKKLYSNVYEIPEDYFSEDRIAAFVDGGKMQGAANAKSTIIDVPPVKGGTNRDKPS